MDFFQNAGLDLFPTLFKLTFYHSDNSIVNNLSESGYLASIAPLPSVVDKLEAFRDTEAKINFVINNLLAKMLFNADKQKLLV